MAPRLQQKIRRSTKKAILDHLPAEKQEEIILARLLIEHQLPGGQTFPDLAHRFRVSVLTCRRWYEKQTDERKQAVLAKHLERERQKDQQRVATEGQELGEDIAGDFKWVLKQLKRIIESAEDDKDAALQLASLKETSRVLEKLANLLGLMKQRHEVTIDVTSNSTFLALRDVMVRTLEQHPEAMATFQSELAAMKGGPVLEHRT